MKHSGNAARNALEARLGDPNFQNELAHVTTSGDRFTATFASTVRDKQTLRVTETYPAAAADGSTMTVHSSRLTIFPCKAVVVPKIRITVQKASSKIRVKSDGTYTLAARKLHCPDTVPFCRVAFETRRESPNGNGKSLGTHRYKRTGGTAAAAVGKLSAAGLRELRRKGKLLVDTQLVILPPTGQQGGVHTAKTVTLVAG